MEGLEKIDKWLHVWTEAEREARIKKPCATALETQGESPASRTEETCKEKGADEWIMPPLVP